MSIRKKELRVITIDTKSIVSITEANQNFSKAARLVDELGAAVIMKNNIPKYLVIEFSKADNQANASDETVIGLSRKMIEKNVGPMKCKELSLC